MQKKKTSRWQVLACCLAVGGMMLNSCSKDEGYDLENIDGTVGLTVSEFKIPSINSTMNIPLNDVFDIEDSEIIYTNADGEYLFEKASADGDVTPAHPSVDRITVTSGGSPDFQVAITALNDLRTAVQDVPEATFNAAFDAAWGFLPAIVTAGGTISLFDYEKDLPDDVLTLKQVNTDTSNGLSTMRVHLGLSAGLADIVNQISQVDVVLPEFLLLKVSDLQGNEYAINNGVITLTNVPRNGIDLVLTIQGLKDFKQESEVQPSDESYLMVRQNVATGKQDLLLHGTAKASLTINRDADLIKDNVRTALKNDNSSAFQLEASTMLSEIVISSARGQFAPDIDLGEIGGVAITGLPDFLNGDNVRLVVANPQLYIDLTSDLDLDGVINSVRLTAKGDRLTTAGQQRVVNIPDGLIKANRSTKSSYVIFDAGNEGGLTPPQGRSKDEFTPIPLNGKVAVTDRSGNTLQIGQLASLVYEIPDSIKFSARGTTTDDEGSIILGQEYNVQPAYTFKAPLSLSKGSYVIYNDSIDNWREDLEDLTLKGEATVVITTDVVNTVPLALTLEITPKFLPGTPQALRNKVTVTVNKTIAPKATTPGVVITLNVKDKDTFEHLDGIYFEALAESVTEGQIETLRKEGQTLKFDKIGASVTGTFVVED